jgi:hypothetical protein
MSFVPYDTKIMPYDRARTQPVDSSGVAIELTKS